jgi:RsiW-degrading membrane proteinase PrsW (M82 family)
MQRSRTSHACNLAVVKVLTLTSQLDSISSLTKGSKTKFELLALAVILTLTVLRMRVWKRQCSLTLVINHKTVTSERI